MRALAFLTLLALAVASVAVGSLPVALLLAGVKAVVVGLVFMELHDAHRAHAVGFALAVALVIAVLVALSA